jgi:hypothetical protein
MKKWMPDRTENLINLSKAAIVLVRFTPFPERDRRTGANEIATGGEIDERDLSRAQIPGRTDCHERRLDRSG